MATRPAFFTDGKVVYSKNFEFEFNPGFAEVQKKKNVKALHGAIGDKTLEVSTKSETLLGVKLSAFNLTLDGKPLECVFQSSKKYQNAGPFTDLLDVPPKYAKRDERHKLSGNLVAFSYKGKDYPLNPKTVFYDWIYIQSVKQNLSKSEIEEIKDYNYFTDIEFNPNKSINCQARTVALIKVILDMFGEIPDIADKFDDFLLIEKNVVRC